MGVLKSVRVKVPASTANLGPGFDSIGLALNLYLEIDMSFSENFKIDLIGKHLSKLPQNKENLIYQVAQGLLMEQGINKELAIVVDGQIPIGRGLGSSASAIVGALVAANELIGAPFSREELFVKASALEHHPDNAGAAMFGGIVVASCDQEDVEYVKISPDEHLEMLVVVPDNELATKTSRNVLPSDYTLKQAVFNVSHACLLVAALCEGRLDKLSWGMRDALHQPYRAALVPGLLRLIEECPKHGALGVALSGAGPTVIALVDKDNENKFELEKFMLQTMADEGVKAQTMWLLPDSQGTQCETIYE